MGKKSRVKTQKSGTGATASVCPKETLNLTSELLQSKFCPSLPSPAQGHVLRPHGLVSGTARQGAGHSWAQIPAY